MSRSKLSDRLARGRARSAQRATIGVLLAAVLIVVIFTGLAISRGVDVVVIPQDAAAGATVTLTQGIGLVIDNRIYAVTGNLAVEVAAPGFVTARTPISAASASNYVEVELREKPAILNFTTLPASQDSHWLVDGVLQSSGAELSTTVPAGSHIVEVRNPYFKNQKLELQPQRGEELERQIELQSIAGSLKLTSVPSGATLVINGDEQGKTNQTLDLPSGVHTVELRRQGFATISDEVRLTEDQPDAVRAYRLVANPAFLTVTVTPPGGELRIDGRLRTLSRAALSLTPGEAHLVEYKLAGYAPTRQQIRMTPGEKRDIELALSADAGVVRIESRPKANIRVDGVPVGMTPMEMTLPAINHRIVLVADGYVEQSVVVQPTQNETRLVSVDLVSVSAKGMADSVPRYTNSIGIEMIRFEPGPFVMGAPRTERGARANEVLRDVTLTIPFYAARTETTQSQFARFAASGAAASGSAVPKTGITWTDAARFCNWLSKTENLTPVYEFTNGRYAGANLGADGYRLPTEAEWEWLARKAGRRKQSRFTWGNRYEVPKSAGNIADTSAQGKTQFFVPGYTDGFSGLSNVGQFGVDRSGLSDLTGNVHEWAHDFFSHVPPGARAVDPAGPPGGTGHVVKGSSWRSGTATELRAAYRDTATEPRDDLGFRVVRNVYRRSP